MTTRVFAYGSNLDSCRMRRRTPSARAVGPAWLVGYRLRFNKRGSRDGTGKANVVRTDRPSDAVPGVLYRVRAAELTVLDRIEAGYARVRSRLRREGPAGPAAGSAWLYVATPGVLDDALHPAPWYLDHVIRGAREHGLPASWVALLEAAARPDGEGG